MNKYKIGFLILILMVISGIILVNLPFKASETDPDYASIENTLRTFSEIKVNAYYSLDGSRFSEVLSNDPRGGPIYPPQFLKLIQWMKGDFTLMLEKVGFLDSWQARYAFQRKINQIYADAIKQGRIVAPTPTSMPPAPTPTRLPQGSKNENDVESLPEIQSLMKQTDWVLGAWIPPSHPENLTPFTVKILSISIVDDLATVKVDWSYGIEEDILVKKDGSWLIVGAKVIEYH